MGSLLAPDILTTFSVAGTNNFYAITRCNWRSCSVMAVIELTEAVAREVGRP
jgi:hypothetical protein